MIPRRSIPVPRCIYYCRRQGKRKTWSWCVGRVAATGGQLSRTSAPNQVAVSSSAAIICGKPSSLWCTASLRVPHPRQENTIPDHPGRPSRTVTLHRVSSLNSGQERRDQEASISPRSRFVSRTQQHALDKPAIPSFWIFCAPSGYPAATSLDLQRIPQLLSAIYCARQAFHNPSVTQTNSLTQSCQERKKRWILAARSRRRHRPTLAVWKPNKILRRSNLRGNPPSDREC